MRASIAAVGRCTTRAIHTGPSKSPLLSVVLRRRAAEHTLSTSANETTSRVNESSEKLLQLLDDNALRVQSRKRARLSKLAKVKRPRLLTYKRHEHEMERIQGGTTPTFSPSFEALYAKARPVPVPNSRKKHRKEPSNNAGWESAWTSDWGADKLTPTQVDVRSKSQHLDRHLPHTPAKHATTKIGTGQLEPTDDNPLQDIRLEEEQQPVAKLAHGLDRVLFNPGVHWVQDPRSRVYNFTPWVQHVPKVTDFDFQRVEGFVKSSRDKDMWALAKRENRTFSGSTSSLTGILCQIYFLLSDDRQVDTSMLSRAFQNEKKEFTPGQRAPVTVVFNYNDGVYALDSAEREMDSETNVLTWMGTMLEKFLTAPKEEFKRHLRAAPPIENPDPRRPAYRFSKSERFVMRSQLDGHDPRLPGTGVFDIKTRAVLPIRLDILNYQENAGYAIRKQHGMTESFEREYYDLIRSAFLKYSYQARIGNMDGVVVAYHNTENIFGFQYVSVEEMEEALYGGSNRGDRIFTKCVGLMEVVADHAIACFPEQSIRCTFETYLNSQRLDVWVEPAEWDEDAMGSPRPIRQLEVTVSHYLGEENVRESRAITDTTRPWTLHWTMSARDCSDEEARVTLEAAQQRQVFGQNLPEGVDMDAMKDIWAAINHNNAPIDNGDGVAVVRAFKDTWFRNPGRGVVELRNMARASRQVTVEQEVAERGKPRIVYGCDEPYQPDAEEIQLSLSMEELPVETGEAGRDNGCIPADAPSSDDSVARDVIVEDTQDSPAVEGQT